MKDGNYISIICKDNDSADINFIALNEALPDVGLIEGIPGNELLIHCESKKQNYPLKQIRDALKRPARVDMFELATDEKSGQQYRNWYYLPHKSIKRKTTG